MHRWRWLLEVAGEEDFCCLQVRKAFCVFTAEPSVEAPPLGALSTAAITQGGAGSTGGVMGRGQHHGVDRHKGVRKGLGFRLPGVSTVAQPRFLFALLYFWLTTHHCIDGDEGARQELGEEGRHEDGTDGGSRRHQHRQRHIAVRDVRRHVGRLRLGAGVSILQSAARCTIWWPVDAAACQGTSGRWELYCRVCQGKHCVGTHLTARTAGHQDEASRQRRREVQHLEGRRGGGGARG